MSASWRAAAIALAVCGAVHVHAQKQKPELPFIEWSGSRKLAVTDFKGQIPSRENAASLSWVAIEAAWDCQEGNATFHARAVFDPNRSWWSEPMPNLWRNADDPSVLARREDSGPALLAHEQLHFDMTEIWTRRIRETFKTLPAACKTVAGPRAFEKMIADLEREWQEEQQRYDRETSHGTNASRQRDWAQKIAKTLRDSYPAAAR
jgi:hypothetical protein